MAASTRSRCAPRSGWQRRSRARRKRASPTTARLQTKALLEAVPKELLGDRRLYLQPDPVAAPRGEIRRGRPADAERAERSGATLQSGRMVDRTSRCWRQDARRRRKPHRLSHCPRRGAPHARQLQDRAGIHRRLDRAAFSQRPRDRRAAFCPHRVGSVNPTALARAGYWQGRAAEAAGHTQEAHAAYTGAAEQSTSYYGQLARADSDCPRSN